MIDVLIVNHFTAAETLALVRSLPSGFRALVLENGSGREDVASLEAGGLAPDVSSVNLGFGAGVNRLAVRASAEWLLLMNPDVVPGEGLFERIAGRLPDDPRVAIVGGVRHGAGPRSWGPFPGLLDRFRAAQATPDRVEPVDWVSGCFMLVRRAVFNRLNGFDEGYFMQLEDVDLCWRARQAGHEVIVDPVLAFAHRGHLSYARAERSLARDYRAGKARFFERSGRPLAALIVRALNPNAAP